jgi:hypothetical protein
MLFSAWSRRRAGSRSPRRGRLEDALSQVRPGALRVALWRQRHTRCVQNTLQKCNNFGVMNGVALRHSRSVPFTRLTGARRKHCWPFWAGNVSAPRRYPELALNCGAEPRSGGTKKIERRNEAFISTMSASTPGGAQTARNARRHKHRQHREAGHQRATADLQ